MVRRMTYCVEARLTREIHRGGVSQISGLVAVLENDANLFMPQQSRLQQRTSSNTQNACRVQTDATSFCVTLGVGKSEFRFAECLSLNLTVPPAVENHTL